MPAFAARTDRSHGRRAQAAAAVTVTVLPLMALAAASLESAVVYAAGQLMRAIGAH